MLKIAVYDCGFGGEMLADKIKEELPIAEVIRVIDWRHAKEINGNRRLARKYAAEALSPYINKVDIIVFANFLLSTTSLNFFKRKYRKQKFIGLNFKQPDTFIRRKVVIFSTTPVMNTFSYHKFVIHMGRKVIDFKVDNWDEKIDDGELTEVEIQEALSDLPIDINSKTTEIVLAHANLLDIKPMLKSLYGKNIHIYDSFSDIIKKLYKELNIRGRVSYRG